MLITRSFGDSCAGENVLLMQQVGSAGCINIIVRIRVPTLITLHFFVEMLSCHIARQVSRRSKLHCRLQGDPSCTAGRKAIQNVLQVARRSKLPTRSQGDPNCTPGRKAIETELQVSRRSKLHSRSQSDPN